MRKFSVVLGLLVVASMILSACGPTEAPPEVDVVAPEAPEAPEAPAAEEPAAPATTRMGGWLDEVVFSVVSSESAVTQLQAGAIDIYAGGLASADLPAIKDAGLSYSASNGLYYNMMYNPAGPVFNNGKLNPFSSRKIREATNWLFDRDYINQEVYAGGGLAKYFAIQTNGPEYADLAEVARELEAKYAYNPGKANDVITAEMEVLGATLVDGKWQFEGEPVTLIFLIRNDSDGTRIPIGDYVANQFESIGFTVDRQYKKSSEAGPIWYGTDPIEGQWHMYTAAWGSSVISRDERDMFQQMYLPTSVQGDYVFLENQPDPAFQKLGDDLANANFNTLAERRAMMEQAMELSLEDSLQVWLIDGKNYTPYLNNVVVTSDLAAGVEGAQIWPYTARFEGQEGGTLKWGEPDLFAEPWNPIAGSNWTFDQAAIRATSSGDFMFDPFTGLVWPLRMEKAEITIQEGLPVGKTHDWVTLEFAPTIEVPVDAWADWDATTQTFTLAGEGVTAKRKAVVYYPADMYDTVKWHDGSAFSAADVVMGLIMIFDRAKEESVIYDEQAVPNYEFFMEAFKGMKITSVDPLVIEFYSDSYSQDAELNVPYLWPNYGFAEASWSLIAVANLAEANGELAYSPDKSVTNEVEQTSFIGGPSLEILGKYLDEAAGESLIPFAPTLGEYITADEAASRYANLKAWADKQKHYWVGTGPYYLDKVFLTESTLTLKHFADFPDKADRWAFFSEPKLADAELDGPGQVKIGDEAVFDVFVTFEGAPYPLDEIKNVKYLLYNAKGELVEVGAAEAVADGHLRVTLTAAVTSALEAGSNKLEVAVVPLNVSVPAFESIDFVTAP
jgi:peptide/nickel transport system substrate-binding protein